MAADFDPWILPGVGTGMLVVFFASWLLHYVWLNVVTGVTQHLASDSDLKTLWVSPFPIAAMWLSFTNLGITKLIRMLFPSGEERTLGTVGLALILQFLLSAFLGGVLLTESFEFRYLRCVTISGLTALAATISLTAIYFFFVRSIFAGP